MRNIIKAFGIFMAILIVMLMVTGVGIWLLFAVAIYKTIGVVPLVIYLMVSALVLL